MAPLLWRSLPLRIGLTAIPFWFTIALFIFNIGWRIELIVGVVFGLTLAAPWHGLLLVCAIAPLGHSIATLTGVSTFRVSEAVVVTWLVGWVLRASPDRRGPRVPAPIVGWLFVATVAASIVGLGWRLNRDRGGVSQTLDQMAHSYFLFDDRIGFVDRASLVEGMALAAATVTLLRQHPRLAVTIPAALAASGIAAEMLIAFGLARTGGHSVSSDVAEANAAGIYLAAVVCIAIGMGVRVRGRGRAIWFGMAGMSGMGLWLSESHGAIAGVTNVPALNKFLHVGAEFGVVGLCAFVLWIAAGLAQSARALWRTPRDARLVGITAGVLWLMGACLIRQPRLGGDIEFPFWILFGLMTALAGSSLLNMRVGVTTSRVSGTTSWSG
jgi:hypothetical protein